MQVVFDGPQPSRTLDVEGKQVEFERGKPVEVPKDLGEALCRQRYFNPVVRPPRPVAKKKED